MFKKKEFEFSGSKLSVEYANTLCCSLVTFDHHIIAFEVLLLIVFDSHHRIAEPDTSLSIIFLCHQIITLLQL
jgi:hypothetical protein